MRFLEKLASDQEVTISEVMSIYDETTAAILRRTNDTMLREVLTTFADQHRRIVSTRIVQASVRNDLAN